MDHRTEIAALLGPDWTGTRLRLSDDVPEEGDRRLRRLRFASSSGESVPALWLPPPPDAAPAPALLYCHAHGGRYDIGLRELTEGRRALPCGPWLPEIARRGWAVLCLEMPCFGARAHMAEGATAKARLWHGRTLWGQMLGELRAGTGWLAAQPGVNPARIGVAGISMGGTAAWWLAALDDRFAGAVANCTLADLATLVRTGAHDLHGPYMTVPGLLARTSTGRLAGCAAPRPLFVGIGHADLLTPPEAWARCREELRAAYRAQGAADRLVLHEAEGAGHEETPEMRAAAFAFLDGVLGIGPTPS